jgi:hypothetical protein
VPTARQAPGGDRRLKIYEPGTTSGWDTRTRDYLARRITEGKTHREAIRCLKRYIAHEIYRIITSPPETQLSAA